MKHKIATCIAAAAVGVVAVFPLPANAQAGLPSYEALTIVQSMGLDPVGRPLRRGSTYVVRALDGYGQEVSVTVDARYGGVLSVRPVGPVAGPYPPRPPARVWSAYPKSAAKTASTPLPKPAPRRVAEAEEAAASPELTTGSIGEAPSQSEASSTPAVPPVQGLE